MKGGAKWKTPGWSFGKECAEGGPGLLAHDDAQAAAPALRQTDARSFEILGEKTHEGIRGRVEAKLGS
jgi:hypothetical protein